MRYRDNGSSIKRRSVVLKFLNNSFSAERLENLGTSPVRIIEYKSDQGKFFLAHSKCRSRFITTVRFLKIQNLVELSELLLRISKLKYSNTFKNYSVILGNCSATSFTYSASQQMIISES